jgi:hypothetical protein
MSTYVVDDWDGPGIEDGSNLGPSRAWDGLVGAAVKCWWDDERSRICAKVECDWSNGVVIIHRSFFVENFCDGPDTRARSESLASALLCAAERYPGLVWVIISGSPQLEGCKKSNLYYRRAPVADPRDEVFRRCYAIFNEARVEYGVTGIDFSLLEPDDYSNLAQVVLALSLSDTEDVQAGLPQAVWRQAESEAKRALKQLPSPGPAFLPAAGWPEGLFETGRSLPEIQGALELLLRASSDGRRWPTMDSEGPAR